MFYRLCYLVHRNSSLAWVFLDVYDPLKTERSFFCSNDGEVSA